MSDIDIAFLSLERDEMVLSQFCFSIGACDPASKRAQGDAFPSGKAVSASGARQSETLRDGRFCATIGAKFLARTARYALRAFA